MTTPWLDGATPVSMALPSTMGTPRRGRRFVENSLRGALLEPHLNDIQLVVSELLTNAVLHGGPPIVLEMALALDGVTVAVTDTSSSLPERIDLGHDASSGRGLLMVERLADGWGIEPISGDGKRVWARLRLPVSNDVPRLPSSAPPAAAEPSDPFRKM